MRVLGIETSGPRGGVALAQDGRVVAARLFDKGMVHGREIAPGIRELCAEAGWPLESLELLACDVGPGSYTGLRVGLAAAKGLAFALKKPVVGVPSLDALAEQGLGLARVLCPAVDAKWNQIYGAVYVDGRRSTEFLAEKPDVFAARVPPDALVLGDALDAYADLFRGRPQAPRERWDPHPGTVARLGERLHAQGVRHDAASLVPLYLRPTEAEIKFGGATPPS
ncbi:MAG TPA: tRNA (adenosine(37)-N6)-threonylcarbamoyltransferase complex dimerization subunit type 1 TsaB [Planctomycetota bacterium]|nr:tRNA (adenosine(37)-N6)-threonylcarbamoyltransferase complex dimerization subunit type 1 TsaB [Planctomycetota bacterium]